MYNRYVPQPDGSYQRRSVEDHPPEPPQPQHREAPKEAPTEVCCPPPPPKPPTAPKSPHRPKQETGAGDFLRRLLPQNLDTGDLIVILLLLLMAGECEEDRNNALLTLAIYLFM